MAEAHPAQRRSTAAARGAGHRDDHAASINATHCRNCGALVEQKFCPACGQSTELHPPTVGEFVHEFLGHHVAIEGPLWRTLVALLLSPGRLTVDYLAGLRQRYIAPLRLYLTFSLILFAVSGLNGSGMKLGNSPIEFRMPGEVSAGVVPGPRATPRQPSGNAVIDRTLARIDAMTPEQRTARINAGVRRYLPYVLIVLVPLLGLLLKLIYWNRGMLYGEHLVVALHAQTAAFIFSLIAAVPLGEWFGLVMLAVVVLQGGIALQRVYGGRWIATVLREALLLLAYGGMVGFALALLATLSLAFQDGPHL